MRHDPRWAKAGATWGRLAALSVAVLAVIIAAIMLWGGWAGLLVFGVVGLVLQSLAEYRWQKMR